MMSCEIGLSGHYSACISGYSRLTDSGWQSSSNCTCCAPPIGPIAEKQLQNGKNR